jgi:hypothetical protein
VGRKSGSHLTRRWREPDSNPRSRVYGELATTPSRAMAPEGSARRGPPLDEPSAGDNQGPPSNPAHSVIAPCGS